MKRSIAFLVFTLLLGIRPMIGANVTYNPEHLVFGKMWMEGGCMAQMFQCLHVEVTNNGEEHYYDEWEIVDSKTGTWFYNASHSPRASVLAGETKDVIIWFFFQAPENYELTFLSSSGVKLFDYSVEIGAYSAPKLKLTLKVDMLEKTDNGNVLYGDLAHLKVSGIATVTNEEDYTIIGTDQGDGGVTVGILPDDLNRVYPICSVCNNLKSGETITKEFSCELESALKEGKEYCITLKSSIDSRISVRIPFTVKQCTNTYWTADGHVKPLPVEDNQVLKVPHEALAVDMRGQYEMNTIFTIDTSEANPNCLYYLGFLDNVPQGFSSEANIIRDYEVKNLVIDAEHDYYCPMPFKAKSALFNYMPASESMGPANIIMNQTITGTVVLPFEAQHVCLTALNDGSASDVSTYGENLKVFRYKEADIKFYLLFEPLIYSRKTGLDAYEPYLLYQCPSPLIFYSEDVMIPSTREAVVSSKATHFVGSTVSQTVQKRKGYIEDFYQWDNNQKCFIISRPGDVLPPFSGYFYMNLTGYTVAQGYIDKLDVGYLIAGTTGNETDIDTPQLTGQDHALTVFSLSGQRVGIASYRDGKISLSGLHPGLYIVGGKKVLVK